MGLKFPSLDANGKEVKDWYMNRCNHCSSYASNWDCSGYQSELCQKAADEFLNSWKEHRLGKVDSSKTYFERFRENKRNKKLKRGF